MRYVITYFGGDHPTSPEEGQKHFAEYQNWLQSLGDAVINGMQPFKDSHHIAADGTVSVGSQVAMSGQTIVEADSIEQAIEMAKSCPFLRINGRLEVAELVSM